MTRSPPMTAHLRMETTKVQFLMWPLHSVSVMDHTIPVADQIARKEKIRHDTSIRIWTYHYLIHFNTLIINQLLMTIFAFAAKLCSNAFNQRKVQVGKLRIL